MVSPHSLSTTCTIRRQKLAGFVATPSPRRRQPAHAATSATESVPQISDCAVIYASTIVHPQLASTASSSTWTDSYKQAKARNATRVMTNTDRSTHTAVSAVCVSNSLFPLSFCPRCDTTNTKYCCMSTATMCCIYKLNFCITIHFDQERQGQTSS